MVHTPEDIANRLARLAESDPNFLINQLRDIAKSNPRSISDETMSIFHFIDFGEDLNVSALSPKQRALLKDTLPRTAAHYADEIERSMSHKAMKEIPGAAEQAMKRLPREGASKHKFLDIKSNIDDIISGTHRDSSYGIIGGATSETTALAPIKTKRSQWAHLEPTRQELNTGVPAWETRKDLFAGNIQRHEALGLSRMKRMEGKPRPHPELAPDWLRWDQKRDLLAAVEDIPRSLTTDEIIDIARINLYADDALGYKLAIDMYRYLEAAGELPYQKILQQASPYKIVKENLEIIIKKESEGLLEEFRPDMKYEDLIQTKNGNIIDSITGLLMSSDYAQKLYENFRINIEEETPENESTLKTIDIPTDKIGEVEPPLGIPQEIWRSIGKG